MFEYSGRAENEDISPRQCKELRVAIFVLGHEVIRGVPTDVFASVSHRRPQLVSVPVPVDSNGSPGTPYEILAVGVGNRVGLGFRLPPADVLGRLASPVDTVVGYAVVAREQINFRHFTLRRYDLPELSSYVGAAVSTPEAHSIDPVDAALLHNGFAHIERLRTNTE